MATIQYCTKCGKRLEQGARFCGSCGTAVFDEKTAAPPRRQKKSQQTSQKKSKNNTIFGAILIAAGILLLAGLLLRQQGRDSAGSPSATESVNLPAVVSDGSSSADPVTEIPRISVLEAQTQLESGTAVVVDVRSTQNFSQGHIPGAISMPLEEIPVRYQELSPEVDIITYCT